MQCASDGWHWRERNTNLSHRGAQTFLLCLYFCIKYMIFRTCWLFIAPSTRRPTHAYDLNRYAKTIAYGTVACVCARVCECECVSVFACWSQSIVSHPHIQRNGFIWYTMFSCCECARRSGKRRTRSETIADFSWCLFLYTSIPLSTCLVYKTNVNCRRRAARSQRVEIRKWGEIYSCSRSTLAAEHVDSRHPVTRDDVSFWISSNRTQSSGIGASI